MESATSRSCWLFLLVALLPWFDIGVVALVFLVEPA